MSPGLMPNNRAISKTIRPAPPPIATFPPLPRPPPICDGSSCAPSLYFTSLRPRAAGLPALISSIAVSLELGRTRDSFGISDRSAARLDLARFGCRSTQVVTHVYRSKLLQVFLAQWTL